MTLHRKRFQTRGNAGAPAKSSGPQRQDSKSGLPLALVAILVPLAFSACGGGSTANDPAQSQATLASEWGFTDSSEGRVSNQPRQVASPQDDFKLYEIKGIWYVRLLFLAPIVGFFWYLFFGTRRSRSELLERATLSGVGSFAAVLAILLILDGCAF